MLTASGMRLPSRVSVNCALAPSTIGSPPVSDTFGRSSSAIVPLAVRSPGSAFARLPRVTVNCLSGSSTWFSATFNVTVSAVVRLPRGMEIEPLVTAV